MTNQQPARSAHTSHQPATTATAWTAPAPTPPKASTQPQRIAGQHQRTAEERQHPGEMTEGDRSTRPQSQHPGEERTQGKERTAASACTQGSQHSNQGQHEDRGTPSRPSRCNPPASQTAEPAPPRRCRGEGRETGEKGKRNGQKMTVKERRPACTPDRASAQALRLYCQQSQHTRTEDSPGKRQRIGESIPLLWSMQNCP